MHMANELLSVPVAAGSCTIAAAAVTLICRKAKKIITSEHLPLMAILGAFIFAAQMVNFQLPLMPGTSGHLVGAVLLAIVLGPILGAIVITSVVIIQCLIFQDGGLLALGCNIINMALVPTFIGYHFYNMILNSSNSKQRMYLAAIAASLLAMTAGAILVPIQAELSGVLTVPLTTFLLTMLGVHVIIGLIEGIITATVLLYLRQAGPNLIHNCCRPETKISKSALYITLIIATIVIGAFLSLLASDKPDGLEWSYADRPDQAEFQPIIQNSSPAIAAADDFHSRLAPLPDYTIRKDSPHTAWTSFAAVVGSAITMAAIWLFAFIFRKPQTQNASSWN